MVLLSSCVPLHFLESLNIVFEHGTSIGINSIHADIHYILYKF